MQMLRDTYRRSRWLMPGFALVLGAVFLVAQWIGGDLAGGVMSFAIMAAFAVILVVLEGRSDAVAIMRLPGSRRARPQHRSGGHGLRRRRRDHGDHRCRDGAAGAR
jgi:hypothetical protein